MASLLETMIEIYQAMVCSFEDIWPATLAVPSRL
jgi:hypothetical protein